MTLSQFRASVRALTSKAGSEGVYVRADRLVRFEVFVQVMAILKNGGITNVGIVAEPQDVSK